MAKYPTITFKSKRAEAAGAGKIRLIGDLTMHGVTKEVALDVEGPSPVLQANGGQRVGASATTKLNRRDFGLQYSRMIEAAPVVGDEILVQIDIEANRKYEFRPEKPHVLYHACRCPVRPRCLSPQDESAAASRCVVGAVYL